MDVQKCAQLFNELVCLHKFYHEVKEKQLIKHNSLRINDGEIILVLLNAIEEQLPILEERLKEAINA